MKNKRLYKLTNLLIIICLIILAGIFYINVVRQSSANKYNALNDERQLRISAEITEEKNSNTEPESTVSTTNSLNTKTIELKTNPNMKYLKINNDFVGWLIVDGTAINYPVVRGNDNSIYLKADFYKNYSDAGAIFMDYRNLGQFQDLHTAIYGHYMKDGSMFHDLHLFKDQTFFEAHKKISLEGLFEKRSYTIFSVYIESANDYTLDFDYKEMTYFQYLQSIKEKSLYQSDLVITGEEKLLTLITCSYEVGNGRIIIHAIEDPH